MKNPIHNLIRFHNERIKPFVGDFLEQIEPLLLIFAVAALFSLGIEYGFSLSPQLDALNHTFEFFFIMLFGVINILRIFYQKFRKSVLGFMLIFALILILLFNPVIQDILNFPLREEVVHFLYLHLPLIIFIYIETSVYVLDLLSIKLNPALVYIISFAILILGGTVMLSLPEARTLPMSFLDILFTSTSASCVTGLIVVDTATAFTTMGKVFLLILIQLGGLGVITFTFALGYLIQGGVTLQSSFMMQKMMSSDSVNKIAKLLFQIIFATLLIEGIGTLLIYWSIRESFPEFSEGEKWFFSLFHSVSAFCNAGFSLLSDGLYDLRVRDNYTFQWIIISLFFIGGIGFYVIFGLAEFFNKRIVSYYRHQALNMRMIYDPHIISLNAKISVYTSLALLFLGTGLFLFVEFGTYDSLPTLQGKFTASLFAAATPRTAGFNTVDMTQLSLPAILLTLFLMWIGASSGSTGGGIKTSTFAILLMTIKSVVLNKKHINWKYIEIHPETIRRASAVAMLSLLWITLATFTLAIINPQLSFTENIFEVVSAISTVGLTIGGTPKLSEGGKILIIITMFVGRVGILTILTAFIKEENFSRIYFPKEKLLVG